MKIPEFFAPADQGGRRAYASDFVGGEGTLAIGRSLQEGGELQYQLFEQEMASKVSGALGQASTELNNLQLEIEAEPDYAKHGQLYAAGTHKIQNKFRKGLIFPKFQGLFDARFGGELERGRMKVAHGVRDSQLSEAKGNRLLFIEQRMDAFQNEPDQVTRKEILRQVHTEVDEGVRTGLWNAAEGAALKIQADNRAEGENLIIESQNIADDLFAQYPDPEKRAKHIQKKYSGTLEDFILKRVTSMQRDLDTNRARVQDARHGTLVADAMAGKMSHAQFLEKVVRAEATGNPISAQVQKSVAGVIESLQPGHAYELGLATYGQLMGKAANPATRPSFLKDSLHWLAGRMDPALIKLLMNEQRRGLQAPGDSIEDMTNRKLAMMGLPVTDAQYAEDKEGSNKSEAFRAMVRNAEMQRMADLGHDLPRDAKQDIVNGLSDEIVIDAATPFTPWFNRDRTSRVYEITPETEMHDIPPEAQKAIREVLGLVGTDLDENQKMRVKDIYRELLLERQRLGEGPDYGPSHVGQIIESLGD